MENILSLKVIERIKKGEKQVDIVVTCWDVTAQPVRYHRSVGSPQHQKHGGTF